MASRHEVEVNLSSAKDLKNVNWRHGSLNPYAVVWVDPMNKFSTKVDQEGDTCPIWNETLVISLLAPVEDSTLFIDIVHAGAADGTKPLIGSARLPLNDVVDTASFGERISRTLQLKRPSGRPQGKVDVKVCVREHGYRAPNAYYAPPHGVAPPPLTRDYPAPPPYGKYPYAAPPDGYPYGAYSAPQPYGYGEVAYSQQPEENKNKSKYGMGTGLAVGAAAGVFGGVALAEGADYVEDKIADDVAERVEDDLRYDDDEF